MSRRRRKRNAAPHPAPPPGGHALEQPPPVTPVNLKAWFDLGSAATTFLLGLLELLRYLLAHGHPR